MTLTPLFFSLSWYRRPHLRRTLPSFSSSPPIHAPTDSLPNPVCTLDRIPFPPLTFGSRSRFNRKHRLYPQYFSREVSCERVLGFTKGDQRVFRRVRTRGTQIEN